MIYVRLANHRSISDSPSLVIPFFLIVG